MARERMVTRTVKGYKVTVIAVDTINFDKVEKVYNMGVDYDTENGLTCICKKYDTIDLRHVKITNTEEFETLYGMTEVDFLKYAKVLPPRSVKADDTEN